MSINGILEIDVLKKVLFVTPFWPTKTRSGVANSAFIHFYLLEKLGYEVLLLLPKEQSSYEHSIKQVKIKCRGTGSMYSWSYCDEDSIIDILQEFNPHLIICEAWQNTLVHSVIRLSHKMKIPIGLISHGISLAPFDYSLRNLVRSIAWAPYRFFVFPRLLKKVKALAVLDLYSHSPRFLDRELAKKLCIPVSLLVNSGRNINNSEIIPYEKRMEKIIIVGYFSYVKNQLFIIQKMLTMLDFFQGEFVFIGEKSGKYYLKCLQAVEKLPKKISKRVKFFSDTEVNLNSEISSAKLILSASITEVQPLLLIEALSYGTPFVATSVGSTQGFNRGGKFFKINDKFKALNHIRNIFEDTNSWKKLSRNGNIDYKHFFSEKIVQSQFINFLNLVESDY